LACAILTRPHTSGKQRRARDLPKPLCFADASGGLLKPGKKGIMKILLQDQKTGLYFQDPENWVYSPDEAHQFLSWTDVMSAKKKHRLNDSVQMVFRFEREGFLIQVPLEGRPVPRASRF
jgi:hypothetical protein